MIPNTTSARPEDDAYNIQRGRPTSRTSTNGLRSTSPSPMDDSSPPSEVDYAECVAANCNMDIEIADPSLPSAENATNFSFSLPASDPRVPPEAAPNPAVTSYSDLSTEPSPPEVIPYNANVPADPSLWDGNFSATSLFGTNEFLNSDIDNITCSLKRMACFLRQRNVKEQDANSIRQLDPFGESAWDFVSAIFESGWDTLMTANKSSIRDNVTKEFGKPTKPSPSTNTRHGPHVTKVPPPFLPAPPRKFWRNQRHANKKPPPRKKPPCPTLKSRQMSQMPSRSRRSSQPYQTRKFSKCTMQLLANTPTKPRKSNLLLKDLPENRLLSRYIMISQKASWATPAPTYSKLTLY